jgi:hypothetical protein
MGQVTFYLFTLPSSYFLFYTYNPMSYLISFIVMKVRLVERIMSSSLFFYTTSRTHTQEHDEQEHTRSRPRSGSQSSSWSASRSPGIPLTWFDSYSFNTYTYTSPSSSSSSRSNDDDDEVDNDIEVGEVAAEEEGEEGESTESAGEESEFDEEDHRRLLFGLMKGGMTPQMELALWLMGRAGLGSPVDLDEDEYEDEGEEEVLESVEEDFERGYGGFPVNSPLSPTSRLNDTVDEDEGSGSPYPYEAYQPEPGLGRVQRWLDGLTVSEMVA